MIIRVAALLALLATPAFAVLPDEVLDDASLEARARALSKGLRCVVCRNESIDESNADIAREMRLLLRERLVAGDSDAEATQALVDRYGEYVLLDPEIGGANLILWGAPLGLLALGGVAAGLAVARRRPAVEALTAEEEERLAELMGEQPPR